MLAKLRIYISPSFLSRYYIRRDLVEALSLYRLGGDILDYGCGQKPYANLFKDCKNYIGIDFPNYSINTDSTNREKPDNFFSKKYLKDFKLPFDNNQFDNCVSFQVLEHHINPHMMLSEISRVTKKGGLLILTAPFLGGIHEEPNDFQRYTKYGLSNLLNKHGYEVKYVKEQGSLFTTCAMLFNEYWINHASKGGLHRRIMHILYPLFLLSSYVAFIMDKFINTNRIVFNYLIVAKKV